MSVINISAILDDLIADFPGNMRLQEALGVGLSNQPPHESLLDIPWDTHDDPTALVRILLQLDGCDGNEHTRSRKMADLSKRYLSLTNRLLMIRLIRSSGYIPSAVSDREILTIYLETAIDGYRAEAAKLITEMRAELGRYFDETTRLARAFGERAVSPLI